MYTQAFLTTSDVVFQATAIDFLSGSRAIVTKSLMTKFVPQYEVGRLLALFSVTYLILGATIPTFYKSTFTKLFPGRYFFISEAFLIPALILFVLSHKQLLANGWNIEISKHLEFMKLICCKTTDESKGKVNVGKQHLEGFIDLA